MAATCIIVTQRADGRGGVRPFGAYSGAQKGAIVHVGSKSYKVTTDGRFNVPKAFFDKYGVEGEDGKKRVGVRFSAKEGKEGWKDVGAIISSVRSVDRDAKTGFIVRAFYGMAGTDLQDADNLAEFHWT